MQENYKACRLLWPFAGVAQPPLGRITANNGEAMRDMAIGGLGLALLPMFIVHDALRDIIG